MRDKTQRNIVGNQRYRKFFICCAIMLATYGAGFDLYQPNAGM